MLWQSQRHEAYREALTWLGEQGLSYYCTCTRARIHAVGGIYDGHCRDLGLGRKTPRCACAKPVRYCSLATVCAARSSPMSRWRERILLSTVATGCSPTTAVVVDDHFQGITEIVRGADLIEPTVRQISLYQHFGWQAPDYLHLPLALNGDGNKLSKQNHAPALPEGDPRPEIVRALRFLNQAIPEEWQALSIDDLLAQAVANWQPAKIEHSQMAPAEL